MKETEAKSKNEPVESCLFPPFGRREGSTAFARPPEIGKWNAHRNGLSPPVFERKQSDCRLILDFLEEC